MADNTTQTGSDTLATDELVTLNGNASTVVKAQRVKIGFGDDGIFRDVSASFPLPVEMSTDGGRTLFSANFTSTNAAVADTLIATWAVNRGATATTGQTSFTVTAGKVLRITNVVVQTRATAATLPYGLLNLRINHTGAVILTSPLVYTAAVSGTAAAIGNTGTAVHTIEGGLELSGTMQLGASYSNNVNTNVTTISLLGYEYTS